MLFLGVITFYLSCYSEIKGKKDDYWGKSDPYCNTWQLILPKIQLMENVSPGFAQFASPSPS